MRPRAKPVSYSTPIPSLVKLHWLRAMVVRGPSARSRTVMVAVAGSATAYGVWAASEVEHPEEPLIAAIRNLEQHGPVALGGTRLQQKEVGREFHQALRIAGRQVDIGDDAVGGKLGVDGEMNLAGDALIAGIG